MVSLSKTANESFVGGLQTVPSEGQECPEEYEPEEKKNSNDDD